MTPAFLEDSVEHAALAWLEGLGWATLSGPSIAPGEPAAERADYRAVVLVGRLRSALARLNPRLPAEALEEAFRRVVARRARRWWRGTGRRIACSSRA